MIDVLRDTEIEDLLTVESDPSLSIYLPTHEKGAATKEDPIRFKNLLRQCERQLKHRGFTGVPLRRLFQSAQAMLDASQAWHYLERALAVFISTDLFRAFTLPFECSEQAWVGTRFHVKPLVPLWDAECRFCVLALSQGQAKLYDADRRGLAEKVLSHAPRDLDEFLRYDEAQVHLQCRTVPSGKSTGTDAVFHGQGNVADDARHKRTVDEYVKAVRNAVEDHLAGDHRPLVLAAPAYIQSVYREASRYSYLLPAPVVLAPDRLSEAQLHDAARDAAVPYFQQHVKARLAQYHHLLEQGQALAKAEDVVAAAQAGRVDTLLVDPAAHAWADPDTPGLDPDEPAEPAQNRRDLLDVAVRWTLTQGGNVYAVARHDLRSQSPAGAILRY